MSSYNLIIVLIIIILSFIFKLQEINKYDTQLIFIILSFLIIIIYKSIEYTYGKRENKKNIEEELFTNSNVNEFINDTMSDQEKIIYLQNKLNDYEKIYGNKILDNNLNDQIVTLQEAITNLEYLNSSNTNEANTSSNPIIITNDNIIENTVTNEPAKLNVNTDAIKQMLINTLEELKHSLVS